MSKWEEDDLDLFDQQPLDLSDDDEISTDYQPREIDETPQEEDDHIVLCPACGEDLTEQTPTRNALHLVGLCPTTEEENVSDESEITQQFVFLKDDIKFRDETPEVKTTEDQQDASVGNVVPLETPATPKKRGRPKKIKVLPDEVPSREWEKSEEAYDNAHSRVFTLPMGAIRPNRPSIDNPYIHMAFYDAWDDRQLAVTLGGPRDRVQPLYEALKKMVDDKTIP